jgi:hypothetical protein
MGRKAVITSVTSATMTATVAAWGIALGAGGAILVILFLIALEMLGATEGPAQRAVQRGLRVAVMPLLTVFAVSVVAKALTILGS